MFIIQQLQFEKERLVIYPRRLKVLETSNTEI